jgi:hypothetical protein
MKTFSHLWQYLAEFFLEWERFHTKVVEEIKTYILLFNNFFFENRAFYQIISKNNVELKEP